jgi:hypothetical protein
MKAIRFTALAAAAACTAAFALPAHAAVSAEEAAKLKTELTPLGAEKAGNKDGTIPAWTGGFKGTIAGDKAGGKRGDPFKEEKPLYAVTAKNMDQHADKLTAGVKALLKKYPDTYRLDVYPTHRTVTAPQWVYDNTAKNALRGKLENNMPTGVYGGIPFPIPKTGEEVMWNHGLRYRPSSWEAELNQYQITAAGKQVLTTEGNIRNRMPYYYEDGSADKFDGIYWEINLTSKGPPVRAGEIVVGRQSVDDSKSQSYIYLAGQRRVRKLPNTCCDSPTSATAGLMSYDELSVFQGRTTLFDYKLLGKKEMLVPYNENRFLQARETDIIKGQHLNPDHVRWELHRVWVVEATLKQGQRHQAPKAVYYVDEDNWQAVLGDRWDAKGQLWKTLWGFNYVMPEVPGTIDQTFGYYDLVSGQAYVANVMNDQAFQQRVTPRWPTVIFTADGVMAQGVR